MREALPIAALAVLATVKLWPIVTPFAGSRLYLGGDFGLAIEPYFYHLLKRGILPLWDATLGTGSPFLGSGTHHPMFLQAHLHLFYPVNLLVLGLLERGQQIPHVVLQYNHLLHYAMAGAFTYLYARQLAVGRFAAAVSGIAFMFSGFMLAHVTHWTMIDTVVWLPAILACVVRTDASLRRRWATLAGRGVPRRPSTALLSRRAGDRRARRHADHAPRGGRRPVGTARGNPAARAGGRTRDRRRAAHPTWEMAVASHRAVPATTGSRRGRSRRPFWRRHSSRGVSSPRRPGAPAAPSSTSILASCP